MMLSNPKGYQCDRGDHHRFLLRVCKSESKSTQYSRKGTKMKLLKIKGFLPDTADSMDHSSVVRMKPLIEDTATAASTTISMFNVSEGTVFVGFADEKALETLAALFAEERDVEVSELTLVSYQRELNRKAQERTDKMRKTRAKNKSR